LVKDIETGKINSGIEIPPEVRTSLEKKMSPMPARALQLCLEFGIGFEGRGKREERWREREGRGREEGEEEGGKREGRGTEGGRGRKEDGRGREGGTGRMRERKRKEGVTMEEEGGKSRGKRRETGGRSGG
jgi:hypothetical protein